MLPRSLILLGKDCKTFFSTGLAMLVAVDVPCIGIPWFMGIAVDAPCI